MPQKLDATELKEMFLELAREIMEKIKKGAVS